MARSNTDEFLWEDFYKSLVEGGYNEFRYKEEFVNVGKEIKGTFRKFTRWVFVVHKHDNTGAEIYSEFKTPQLLIENARVDGKSLKEIWDELILD